ncbi:MAG: UDP-glucose dehydrogenase family protein, partial [Candidatus Margulisiibacteriota bacterium]
MNLVVVGMGYVGLVAACCLANSGHRVFAVDKDATKLRILKQGKIPFYEEGLNTLLQKAMNKRSLFFTSNLATALQDSTIVIVAVGTPSLPDGRVDLSQVYGVVQEIVQHVRRETIIVMKSTVPPGTGRSISKNFLSSCQMPILYISNPEFLREGRAVSDWYHPDRIVVGCNDEMAAKKVIELYADIEAPKIVMDITSAEMVKYASNAFLATKISFINEIANLCELLKADIDKVVPALGMDHRIGPHFLQPGI